MNQLPEPPVASLVEDDESLESLCERWAACRYLAVDTEFIRTRTFFPKLGLIQVADPERIYLIDAVALTRWDPWRELLTERSVGKVLHSPSEDLEVFEHAFGVAPEPLVDTQIAATLVGAGAQPGYSRLVESLFGVVLPKGEQRSNWLQRPLSDSQRRYAALDVAYLLPAWELLEHRLEECGRVQWFEDEMVRQCDLAAQRNSPEFIYARMARSNFDELQAGALYRLVEWREAQARRRDLPRRFVLGDDVLIELARKRPRSMRDLSEVESLGGGQRRRLGDTLLAELGEAGARDLSQERLDHTKVSKSQLRPLREALESVASEHDLPPSFLASKKALERLARRLRSVPDAAAWSALDVPRELRGWRWRLLEPAVRRAMDC